MRKKSYLLELIAMLLPLLVNAETKTFTQEGIKYSVEDVGPLVASVIGSDEDIENAVIPETIIVGNIEYTVTSISYRAFYDRKKLRSVTVPNTVTTIGRFAFSGGEYNNGEVISYRETQLSSIRIGSGVKKIGYNAFTGCKNLTDVYISDLKAWMKIEYEEWGVIEYLGQEIGNPLQYASCLYLNNEKINHITVPDGILSIGKSFYKFKGLASVTICNSVTTIGEYAFSGCTNLSNIELGNSVTKIGEYAFRGCTNIKSVYIPNSVKYLDEGVFYGCKNMASVTIGNNISSIGRYAFYNCTILSSVYISDIASWCKIAFYDNPLSIARHLYLNNEEVNELIIPENAKSISASAFSGCVSITSVTLPSSLTSVGESAFKNCTGLRKVTVGKSVKTISSKSFENCTALSDFTCLATEVPAAGSGAFTNPGAITLHVPDVAVDMYKSYNPWASFKNVVPIVEKHFLIYMVDGEVYKSYEIKSASTIIPETEPVKEGYTFSGWSEIPEEMPAHDVTVTGTFTRNPLGKCASPTINIINGELVFGCETEDVEYHYEIKHLDVKIGNGNNVKLGNTYRISVSASKDGYEDSDVTTRDFQFAVGKKGDVDGNGVVNAADVVQLTDIIMSGAE